MSGFSYAIPRLAEVTLCGSVAIVLLLMLRPLIRRWLGARAVHGLWLVVLLRLLVPWTPHAPMAMLPARAQNEIARTSVTVRSFVVGGGAAKTSAISSLPAQIPEKQSPTFAASIADSVILVWLAGAAGVFALSLAGALRTAPLMRRAREIAPDSRAMRILATLSPSWSAQRLRILETGELKSPALCGLLRPTILLPPGWAETMAPEELRCVLLHEIGHHRRGDVLWRWTFLLARALHWFNPFVWLAEREMRADQEMACDEWVLAHANNIDAQSYGSVLLRACRDLAPPAIASPGHAAMAESSSGLAQRIRHLARLKPHGWGALAGAIALGGLFFVIGPAPTIAQSAPASSPSATPNAAIVANPAPSPAPPLPPPTQPVTVPPTSSAGAVNYTGPQIEIASRFLELTGKSLEELERSFPGMRESSGPLHVESILEEKQLDSIIRKLNQTKGVDLLSAPRVTTKPGQRAVVEIIREFRYPTEMKPGNDGTGVVLPTVFETRNTGVTLEVQPAIRAGGIIDMEIVPSVVQFAGFVNYGAARPARKTLDGDALTELMKSPSTKHVINQPIFETRKITTEALVRSGQTVVVGGLSRTDTQMVEDESSRFFARHMDAWNRIRTKKTSEQKVETYLLIFVTARILSSEGVAPPAGRPDAAPQSSPSVSSSPHSGPLPGFMLLPPATPSPPSAIAVPGKPGFVTSPFAPNAGYVDVRGFAPGTEVKCPYTGKFFLTP